MHKSIEYLPQSSFVRVDNDVEDICDAPDEVFALTGFSKVEHTAYSTERAKRERTPETYSLNFRLEGKREANTERSFSSPRSINSRSCLIRRKFRNDVGALRKLT